MPMRGLTIIVATSDPVRLRAALEIAAVQAAIDRPAHLFLQSDAAPLLRGGDDIEVDRPTLIQMLEQALGLGVKVTVCQSGLALAGMIAAELPEGVETGGLVGLLAGAGDDQLLMA